MDVDDRLPLFDRHVVKNAIAQDAGIVDHRMDRTEGVDGGLDDAVGRFPFSDAVGVRHRRAAGFADFVDHQCGRAVIVSQTVGPYTRVVDQNFGAGGRHGECDIAPDTPARAGHDHNLVFHHAHGAVSPDVDKLTLPEECHSPDKIACATPTSLRMHHRCRMRVKIGVR